MYINFIYLQNEDEIKKLTIIKQNIQKSFEDQKIKFWELEAHIRKVGILKSLIVVIYKFCF